MRIVDIKLPFKRDKAFIPGILRAGVLPVLFLTALLFLPCQAFADWSPLIDLLAADGFDEPVIRELFLVRR